MKRPAPRSYLHNLPAYIGGKSKIAGKSEVIKLSSNENPQGPCPGALQAYQAARALHRYPQDGAAALCEALAAHHGIAASQIICGAGSDDVIRMLMLAYVGPGDEVIHTAHAFAMYAIYAAQHGATPVSAAETDLRADVDTILQQVTPRTRLVCLANPNNPTGTYLPKTEIHRLRAALPEEVILLLDGAYAEYLTHADYADGMELVETTNTVAMRTFSKAYGLASLRVGWGYGPQPIIESMYKTRSPFNLTQAAIDAAIAALSDQTYLAAHLEQNAREKQRLEEAIERHNALTLCPTEGNFSLVKCEDAAELNRHLLAHGIIVRELANYGLSDHLRISIGTAEEITALIDALKAWRG